MRTIPGWGMVIECPFLSFPLERGKDRMGLSVLELCDAQPLPSPSPSQGEGISWWSPDDSQPSSSRRLTPSAATRSRGSVYPRGETRRSDIGRNATRPHRSKPSPDGAQRDPGTSFRLNGPTVPSSLDGPKAVAQDWEARTGPHAHTQLLCCRPATSTGGGRKARRRMTTRRRRSD
ncbi:hypothetical protein BH20PSE1_BH20PSE1_13020 [soil metagenome]